MGLVSIPIAYTGPEWLIMVYRNIVGMNLWDNGLSGSVVLESPKVEFRFRDILYFFSHRITVSSFPTNRQWTLGCLLGQSRISMELLQQELGSGGECYSVCSVTVFLFWWWICLVYAVCSCGFCIHWNVLSFIGLELGEVWNII